MRPIIAALLLAPLLCGCGSTWYDRAITGGAMGAAGGALLLAPIGLPLTGATIGAPIGGLAGILTLPEYQYFGEPAWYDSPTDSPTVQANGGIPDYARYPTYPINAPEPGMASPPSRAAASPATAMSMPEAAPAPIYYAPSAPPYVAPGVAAPGTPMPAYAPVYAPAYPAASLAPNPSRPGAYHTSLRARPSSRP